VRVLYLIDSLVPGGAEQSLAAMAVPLRDVGVTLEIAVLHQRAGFGEGLVEAGVVVSCLAGPGGRAGWLARAVRLARLRRPDLIHTTLYEANLVGRATGVLTRTPVVSSLVNVPYGAEQRRAPGLDGWKVRGAHALDLTTARAVVRFHAITAWVADVMAPRLRIDRDRIDVVPRGRDEAVLGRRTTERRARARADLGLEDPGSPVLLAAARQEHQKGLDTLLEAMPAVLATRPEVRLVVAGRRGNQTPLLEATVERLGLGEHARFLGVRSDVAELLCAADAFVVPSRWEGLGSVLLEAMALEAPIVVSDLPPVREVLPDEHHARFVPPGRPGELAAAVLASLADPEAAARRAEAARARFMQRFTIERVAREMAAFYERALVPTAR
jgi:glycosyltransferase involved in cell wall biosynthesis